MLIKKKLQTRITLQNPTFTIFAVHKTKYNMTGNKIKALFFDIDGTLVSFKTHEIPQSTIDAIHEARQAGVKVFIATGRPIPFIDNISAIEYDGIVSANGACCISGEGKLIRCNAVCSDDLYRLAEYNKEHDFPIAFASEKDVFITSTNEASDKVFKLLNVRPIEIRSIEESLNKQIIQIIAFFTKEQEPEIMAEVLRNCDAHRWHPDFADVIAKGNSKSTGIDAMLDYYGINLDESMAFGDGGNDISMLKHAGIGVAMGNASDEVKKYADIVTASVDEDGIAQMLKRIGICK